MTSRRFAHLGLLCRAHKLPEPVAEHRFHPKRRWRFDWAFVEERIAVEIEGAVWTQGRHTRGAGYIADAEKYNTAQLDGWIVLRYTPQQVATKAIADIRKAFITQTGAEP